MPKSFSARLAVVGARVGLSVGVASVTVGTREWASAVAYRSLVRRRAEVRVPLATMVRKWKAKSE